MSDPVVLLSTGDVVGPAGGVTDNSMVLFSGTSGKLIKGNNAVVTSAGLALLDDVNAAAQRATLGLGTAATATLTTSATDTTAGRVLKVGDFGLGGSGAAQGTASLDTLISTAASQMVYVATANVATCNGPSGAVGGVCYHYAYGAATAQAVQVYMNIAGTAAEWMRIYTGGAWSAWREVWTTSNLVKTASPVDATAGRLTKVGDFGVGGMLDLRGTSFVTGKPQDLYSKGFVKGFADGGPAGLAIPGLVSINYGILEVNAHWLEPSGAGGIMRSFTQGFSGIVYTQTMANATTWGSWIATWNTSNLVKQTAKYDDTAGSVLTVGAFGLGGAQTWVDYNLNTLVNTGVYYCGGSSTNMPRTDHGHLQVYGGVDASYCVQIYDCVTTGAVRYIRYLNGGVWGGWREIALTDSPAFTGTPTAPTASAGTSTTQVATTAFVSAAVGAVIPGIGQGQTWQDVAASRVLGTTYTNSTGRTIAISFVPVAASNKTHSLTISGSVIAPLSYGTATVRAQLFGIVPPGETYKVDSTSTIGTWMELR